MKEKGENKGEKEIQGRSPYTTFAKIISLQDSKSLKKSWL